MKFLFGNQVVDVAYINGYHFGDKIIEGVLFEINIKDNKLVVVGVHKRCERYFNLLNKELFINAAQDFIDYDEESLYLLTNSEGRKITIGE